MKVVIFSLGALENVYTVYASSALPYMRGMTDTAPKPKKKKKKKKPVIPIDLAIPADRKRAWNDLTWGDHGFLRVKFQNLHQISDEMWRSNQPSPQQVKAHVEERGIKTIVNLRGESPKGYYELEKEACAQYGVTLVDFQVFSRDTPTKEKIFAANELFASIEYPAVMHCKSGADRAGLMSVLYKLLREKVPFEEAIEQLSLKYLHVRQGKTGVLDAVFKAYSDAKAETGIAFLDWVERDYDRVEIKREFMESFEARLRIDRILGRE